MVRFLEIYITAKVAVTLLLAISYGFLRLLQCASVLPLAYVGFKRGHC